MKQAIEVRTLADLIAERAARQADDVALCGPERQPAAYADLETTVDELRRALRERGIGRGDCVAVALPSGPDAAAFFLALAGMAVAAPLNPVLSAREFGLALRDLDAVALVVGEPTQAQLEAAAARGVPVMKCEPDLQRYAGSCRLSGAVATAAKGDPSEPDGDDVALVLPTSGTTGRPKLVPLTHSNILAAAHATVVAHELTPEDCRLNVMPLHHVQGLVGAVVASAAAGGRVACTSGFDPTRIDDWLTTFGATWLSASPTMYRVLLNERRGPALGRLRFIRVGSAALPASLGQELKRYFRSPVIESYGMTEAHQIASTPLPPKDAPAGSVGLPTGSEVAIVDRDGASLETGEVGEIVIRGQNVMAGYLSPTGVDRDAFIDGWFRTGDVGVLSADGFLSIVGRLKEIINRGGEKIAPREVEEVLLEHPAVAEAVVFGVPHPVLIEDVAAAIVLAGDTSEDELRRYAARSLAPFKVPRRVVFVAELPWGPTGKIRRSDLGAAAAFVVEREETSETVSEDVMAQNAALEAALSGVWCEVLGLPQVDRDEDFFFLGGDSLTGTRLLALVREAFGVDIPPLAVYDQASTVATMAQLIAELRST